jgi:hypothetical protein
MGRGFIEAKHKRSHVGKAQPVRYDPTQDASLLEKLTSGSGSPFPGDDEHEGVAGGLRAAQKSDKGVVRLRLAHPVQVDHSIDPPMSPSKGKKRLAVDWHDGRRGWARAVGG